MSICGILLAAGAGSRMGTPKALIVDADGRSWLRSAVSILETVGCSPVIVVLGARAADARKLLTGSDVLVVESDWERGLGTSLRCGLEAAQTVEGADAAAITLVDIPDMNAATATRVAFTSTPPRNILRRAVFHGNPGHPVLVGRDHWPALIASLTGDRGAGSYLREHGAESVECSDLSSGIDVDFPPD